MKRRQLWSGLCASVGMLILILDGKTALEGAQMGIELCLKTVIPSLFPFFVLSILLTNSFAGASPAFLRPVCRLFGIPRGAESILLSGFLGGYPVGAQCVSQAFQSGQLKREAAEAMLAFCSNAGPAFLFGMVSVMFPEKWMVWALWGIHILSALMVSRVVRVNCESVSLSRKADVSISLTLNTALRVMASVCGWIVLFRVVIAFLNRWVLWLLPMQAQVAAVGLLELSNGCCELLSITDVSLRFVICSGILAFGGFCVAMQTVSVTKGLSVRYYFTGKLLQTVFSLLLSSAVIHGSWLAVCVIVTIFLLIPGKQQKKSSIRQAIRV